MSRGYAVELYFESFLENQVQEAEYLLGPISTYTPSPWTIPTSPHIILLSSSSSIEPAKKAKVQNIIKDFAAKQKPFGLSFSLIGSTLPPPNNNNINGSVNLFLVPTPSVSLLQFQSELCEELKKEGGVEIGEEHRADSWSPYCVIAQDVPRNRMDEALCVLRDVELPVAGDAMEIGLAEFDCEPIRPVKRDYFSFARGDKYADF